MLYGFLAVLVARKFRPAPRLSVALGALILVFLIAVSRLYLGAHWFSDVVGGAAFGSAWLMLLSLFYLRRPAERIGSPALLVAACAALVLAGGVNIFQNHATDVGRYAVQPAARAVIVADWQATGWQTLPAWRVDLTGETEEPPDVPMGRQPSEFAGRSAKRRLETTRGLVSDDRGGVAEPERRRRVHPVVPLFASGRLPDLTLIQSSVPPGPSVSRLVLRLWATDMELQGVEPEPLWTGSIMEERVRHPLSLVTVVSTGTNFNVPRQALARSLGGGSLMSRTGERPNAGWDGRVLLAGQK